LSNSAIAIRCAGSISFFMVAINLGALSQTTGQQPMTKEMVQQSMNRRVQVSLPQAQDNRNDRKLTRLEEIPDIPPYPGKTELADGHELSGDGRLAYRFKFYAKEKPEEVAQWYANALSSYNWTPVDKTQTDLTMKNKQGSTVTVNALSVVRKDFISVVKLYYNQAPTRK
jgi:hypothetical protein